MVGARPRDAYRVRVSDAARRFGIEPGMVCEAAQHAPRWRRRIRRNWRRSSARASESSVSSNTDSDSGGGSRVSEPDSDSDWPQKKHFPAMRPGRRRGPSDHKCSICGHKAPFKAWLEVHRARVHPPPKSERHGEG